MASWILNDTPSKVFPLYSRANVGEVFPDPISPLNATTGFLSNLEPGWKAAFVACEVWGDDIDGAQNYAEILPTDGAEALVDTTENPVFGSAPATARS